MMVLQQVLSEIKRQLRQGVPPDQMIEFIEQQRYLSDDERAVLWLYVWVGGEPACVHELLGELALVEG